MPTSDIILCPYCRHPHDEHDAEDAEMFDCRNSECRRGFMVYKIKGMYVTIGQKTDDYNRSENTTTHY